MRRLRLPKLDDLLGKPQIASSEPPALIVVGLGNPGPKYAPTRHNAGFWCIDRFAARHGIVMSRSHQTALLGEGVVNGKRVVLAKPRTFVNRSGEAVRYLMARYGVPIDRMLIVYDDIALAPGRIRLRARGSAGGHNGIKSVIEAASTQEFPRLRIGVGAPGSESDQIGHVLGVLSADEQKAVDDAIERAADSIEAVLSSGIDSAMNVYNTNSV
jgi:PTH1 family peptidyl-tRNA hydrolase